MTETDARTISRRNLVKTGAAVAAATPVVYLSVAPELSGETGWYLHLMRRKSPAPLAVDAASREVLWSRGEELLARWLPEGRE